MSISSESRVFNVSELTIRLATNEEIIQARTLTFPMWGGGLTLERFLDRDAVMDKLPHAKDGLLCTWVLVPRNASDHPFLSACETYKRESLVVRNGEAIASSATSYGIASVFTAPQYRRRGYANHMLRLLHHIIAIPDHLPPFPTDLWGAPPAKPPSPTFGDGLFSILASDIGPHYYAKCGPGLHVSGWVVQDPSTTTWSVEEALRQVAESQPVHGIQWIGQEELDQLLVSDLHTLKVDLSSQAVSSSRADKVTAAISPTSAQVNFLIARSKLTYPNYCSEDVWGVAYTDPVSRARSYASFVPDGNRSTLQITRLGLWSRDEDSSQEAFVQILKAALERAKKLGLKEVDIWNLGPDLNKDNVAPFGGKSSERTEHLYALAWYGEEGVDSVNWSLKERYAWC